MVFVQRLVALVALASYALAVPAPSVTPQRTIPAGESTSDYQAHSGKFDLFTIVPAKPPKNSHDIECHYTDVKIKELLVGRICTFYLYTYKTFNSWYSIWDDGTNLRTAIKRKQNGSHHYNIVAIRINWALFHIAAGLNENVPGNWHIVDPILKYQWLQNKWAEDSDQPEFKAPKTPNRNPGLYYDSAKIEHKPSYRTYLSVNWIDKDGHDVKD